MGFLRKVGRKVKKKLNKVFGQKLGNIIGMVGLYFAMHYAAKGLNGLFGPKTPTTPPNTEAGEVVKQTSDTLKVTGDKIKGAANTKDASKIAFDGIEKAAADGTLNTATTTITDSVEQVSDLFTDGDIFKSSADQMLVPTEGSTIQQAAFDPKKFAEFDKVPGTRGARFAEGVRNIGEGIKSIPSKTGEFIADLPQNIVEAPGKAFDYVTGDDFLPDVGKGAATSYLTAEILGEPEEQFSSAGVAGQPTMEAAQGAYLAEVKNQIPNLPAQNFQDLSRTLFYGTLSPQFLIGQQQSYG